MNKSNHVSVLETQEMLQKLIASGFGEVIDCLLSNENRVYTKKGRLNKSSTCRELGWKGKQLEDALRDMREILRPELDQEWD